MSARPKPVVTYNLATVVCTVGSVPISNYGEDGGVDIELPASLLESKISADGFVVYEAVNDDRVTVKITVSATSRVAKLLLELATIQMDAVRTGQPMPAVPFGLFDPATGDRCDSPYAVFIQTPTPSKGKAVGTREFDLELPYARSNIKLGENNQPV